MTLSQELIQRILTRTADLEELASVPIEELHAVRSDPDNIQWSDGAGLLAVRAATQAVGAHRSATYLMSTANAVGRTRDIIEVGGWDLTDFDKRSRPLLYNHNLTESHDHLPLGRMDNVHTGRARNQAALIGDAVFTPQGSVPFNDMVYRLVDDGFFPGSSVGYHALETRLPKNEEEVKSRGLGPMSIVITRASLVEFSLTPVGMDPDATKLSALKRTLTVWEDQYGRDTVQHFRELTRGLEPEPTTTITVPEMPFGAVVEPEPVVVGMSTTTGPIPVRHEVVVAETCLTERLDQLEGQLAEVRTFIDAHGRSFTTLSRSVQNILDAFGVEAEEPAEESPADNAEEGSALYDALFDEQTLAALFGGSNEDH